MLQWLSKGVPLQWGSAGPPPPFDLGEYPLRTEEQRQGWAELREDYLATGAIARAPPSSQARISCAFLVEKGRDTAGAMRYRLCVDLRRINKHLRKVGLRYERLKDFGALLTRGDSLVGFDIKNAYHHLRMRGEDEHFLYFRMQGELFVCKALPFGLSLSPFFFTHLMLVIVRFLRSPGSCPKAAARFRFGRLAGEDALSQYYAKYCQADPATLLAYLDDFLASMADRQKLKEWVDLVKPLFRMLGVEFKESKCQWDPVCQKRHLGVLVDTTRGQFLIPRDKIAAISALANKLRIKRVVVARELARFCGVAISVHLAFPLARFFLTSLYADLRQKRSWRDHIRLSPQALLDLEAWGNIGRLQGGDLNPDARPFHGTLATDASLTGWGATYTPVGTGVPRLARGFFDREFLHINIREMQAVERALRSFFPSCCRRTDSRRIKLMVDSQVVLYCIKAMTSHSPSLMAPLRRLQAVCTTRHILLQPEYIPSKDNLTPDRLSRIRTGEDYRLHPRIFARLEREFGTRSLDRFASANNSLCPQYNTEYWDIGTSGVNAFAMTDWEEHSNWCNPPWSLLPRLVAFLAQRPRVEAVVLAPDWPSAVWFPRLRRLATAEIRIEREEDMFLPGDPSLPARLPPPRWNLRAFHLTPGRQTWRLRTPDL